MCSGACARDSSGTVLCGVGMASMKYVMLLIKDVPKAARFYSEGLGLPLLRMTDRWAELDTGAGPPLALKAVDR